MNFSDVNIFYGGNAQGKTSLLEAIYFLFTGKSFRTFIEKELISWGTEYSYIKGEVFWQEQNVLLESAMDINGEKKIKINQKLVKKQKELIFLFPVIVFTQEEAQSIKEEPSYRRLLLDRFISMLYYQYGKTLIEYQKALYQRNLVLKSSKDKKDLDIWNDILIEKGSQVLYYRFHTLREIKNCIGEISKELLEENLLEIEYYSSIPIETLEEKKIKENFQQALNNSLEKDLSKGYTTVGPHRDDLLFYWKRDNFRYNLRKFGSRGERKIASLIWKLSEVRLLSEKRKEKSILLIDDLFAELDEKKQEIVWNAIKNFQVFVTTTQRIEFLKDFPIFQLISGEIFARV